MRGQINRQWSPPRKKKTTPPPNNINTLEITLPLGRTSLGLQLAFPTTGRVQAQSNASMKTNLDEIIPKPVPGIFVVVCPPYLLELEG